MLRHRPPELRAMREPYLATSRSRMGEDAWKKAWEEAKEQSFEDTVAYALEGVAPA